MLLMPNRIIREGLVASKKVTSMSEAAQLFYLLLLLKADDFGRFDAHPTLLRAACYPYRIDKKTDAQISGYLQECVRAHLIQLYSADGQDCLFIFNYRQQTRQQKSRYPNPPEINDLSNGNHTDEQSLSEPINKCTLLSYSSVGDVSRLSIIADDKSSTPDKPAKKQKTFSAKPETEEECVAFVVDKLHLSRSDGLWLWDHWMACGFRINGRSMTSWKHAASNWKTQRYFPSLKDHKR